MLVGVSSREGYRSHHDMPVLRPNEDVARAITRDPETMHGVPVFRGTRVPVQTLFDYLAGGDTLEDFMEGFPTVRRALASPGSAGGSQATIADKQLMRLLIDECVDERLRLLFRGHECQTARFANLSGLKNGQLLDAAEAAGFDVVITVDQNIPDQQNLAGRRISLVILCGPTNRLCDLVRRSLPTRNAGR